MNKLVLLLVIYLMSYHFLTIKYHKPVYVINNFKSECPTEKKMLLNEIIYSIYKTTSDYPMNYNIPKCHYNIIRR